MPRTHDQYRNSPEPLVVGMARRGDRDAFAELVHRRQSWIRNLMRQCCGEATLADDLAQQTFFQAWRKIGHLRQADSFGAWLRRLAINEWLQHLRVNDALKDADPLDERDPVADDTPGAAMDLERALATLSNPVRLCVVLTHRDGLSHGEIADLTGLPLGTVKSHIRRGTQRLQQALTAYRDAPPPPEET